MPREATQNPVGTLYLDEFLANDPDHLAGLELMEKRLLTLLDDTLHSDTHRRQSLTETLTTIRREKAEIILKLTPSLPGAALAPTTP